MRVALALAAVAATAGTAVAQPSATVTEAPGRRDRAISVGLWSLSGLAGLQGQYEEPVASRPGWSWIAGGGFRMSATGDYSSATLAVSGEARYWITGRAYWTHAPPSSPIGWFAGARLDLAWTRTHDDTGDRTVGSSLSTAVTATFGYRFLIKRRVEVTPLVGLGLTHETDLRGRLPGLTRGTPRMGMTVGWMF